MQVVAFTADVIFLKWLYLQNLVMDQVVKDFGKKQQKTTLSFDVEDAKQIKRTCGCTTIRNQGSKHTVQVKLPQFPFYAKAQFIPFSKDITVTRNDGSQYVITVKAHVTR